MFIPKAKPGSKMVTDFVKLKFLFAYSFEDRVIITITIVHNRGNRKRRLLSNEKCPQNQGQFTRSAQVFKTTTRDTHYKPSYPQEVFRRFSRELLYILCT